MPTVCSARPWVFEHHSQGSRWGFFYRNASADPRGSFLNRARLLCFVLANVQVVDFEWPKSNRPEHVVGFIKTTVIIKSSYESLSGVVTTPLLSSHQLVATLAAWVGRLPTSGRTSLPPSSCRPGLSRRYRTHEVRAYCRRYIYLITGNARAFWRLLRNTLSRARRLLNAQTVGYLVLCTVP